ncbi:hypothetical protein MHL39_13470 [Roseomonas mucosa]|uniref:hypothetical protein n=1 Tax=Roseomonas mucosa TaxID=207340 RepID=UPI001EF43EBB|nr:hypothetical protein [Roseomonas mucosa]MCG7357645.1 hypothetical protein [Roseomonas mucosa]
MPEQPAPLPPGSADALTEILILLRQQNGLLLALGEQVGQLVQLMARPQDNDPSLEHLVTGLVEALRGQSEVLDRLDGRTLALGTDLPAAIARELASTLQRRDLSP